ncbi:uncharacterized protein [Euphorbia lathyris]|uniref:uncharacterized protein isoform X2 n=1 Tax=Euphorbia lathyris TaxID=212925 RepID=UPI0033134F42
MDGNASNENTASTRRAGPTELISMQTSQESLRNEQNSSASRNRMRITHEDFEVVQNLIERCLQLYMTRDEVVKILLHQARIEPHVTILVWQKLEEGNAEFFKAYYARIALKKQIILFNRLIEHHYHLLNPPIQNAIQHMPVNNLPMGFSILQQPSTPSESMYLPSCYRVNGIPASADVHQMQIDSGLESLTDPVSASPASVVSNDQYPFTLGLDASAFESAYAFDMTRLEGMRLGPDFGIGNSNESPILNWHFPWNLDFSDLALAEDQIQMGNYSGSSSDMLLDSGSDILLDSSDEEFFNDPDSQTEK